MPSELMLAAMEYRKKNEALAQKAASNLTAEEKVDYLNWFPLFDPDNEGYDNGIIVNFRGKLYENLMPGNKMSPEDYAFAWRSIDPEANKMEDLVD